MRSRETQRPVRVLLADNHTMFRQSIVGLLQADGDVEIVGDADRGEEAVILAGELKPDMIIMQVDENIEEARDELERMLAASPHSKLVILSLHDEPHFVRRVLSLSISAYIHKSSSADELLALVRSTALDPDGQSAVVLVLGSVLEQVQSAAEPGLSARGLEILLWSARGLSNYQIANRIHIAEATVKRHLANVYPKLGWAPVMRPLGRVSPKVGSWRGISWRERTRRAGARSKDRRKMRTPCALAAPRLTLTVVK